MISKKNTICGRGDEPPEPDLWDSISCDIRCPINHINKNYGTSETYFFAVP